MTADAVACCPAREQEGLASIELSAQPGALAAGEVKLRFMHGSFSLVNDSPHISAWLRRF
jgi:hypothetical protein